MARRRTPRVAQARGPTWANNHNVYILGAGFSAAAGMPLVSQFFERMRDAAASLDPVVWDREISALRRVLTFRLQSSGAAYRINMNIDDIEELFSLASMEPSSKLDQDLALAIAATLEYCKQTRQDRFVKVLIPSGFTPRATWVRTSEGTQDGSVFKMPLYDYLVGVISGTLCEQDSSATNTIVTFNYDTVVEEALASLGQQFTYCLDSAEPTRSGLLKLLKLHGSVNWGAGGNGPYDSYDDLVNAGTFPALVPPTWRKAFDDDLAPVWDAAVRALKTATRLVIIGFSLRPTDLHFKYLLGAGFRENISLRRVSVIDPNAETPSFKKRFFSIFNFERIGGDSVEFQGFAIDQTTSFEVFERIAGRRPFCRWE